MNDKSPNYPRGQHNIMHQFRLVLGQPSRLPLRLPARLPLPRGQVRTIVPVEVRGSPVRSRGPGTGAALPLRGSASQFFPEAWVPRVASARARAASPPRRLGPPGLPAPPTAPGPASAQLRGSPPLEARGAARPRAARHRWGGLPRRLFPRSPGAGLGPQVRGGREGWSRSDRREPSVTGGSRAAPGRTQARCGPPRAA